MALGHWRFANVALIVTWGCGPLPLDVINAVSVASDAEAHGPTCDADCCGCSGAVRFASVERQALERFGDPGGTPGELACPEGDVVVGIVARVSDWQQSEGCGAAARWLTTVGIQCASVSANGALIDLTPSITTTTLGQGGDCGTALTDTVACPSGQILVGYVGHTRKFDTFSKTSGMTLYCAAMAMGQDGSLQQGTPLPGPVLGVTGDASSSVQLCTPGAVTRLLATAGVVVDSLSMECQIATSPCAAASRCE